MPVDLGAVSGTVREVPWGCLTVRRISPVLASMTRPWSLRIHATDVYEALTSDAIEAAVMLSKSWPSAPASAQSHNATQLDDAKRRVEAHLVMMESDPAGHISVPVDFMDRYKTAGGVETTGAIIHEEIGRWAQRARDRVPSVAMMAENIELFAQ